jgi:uncharacterized membrane protein
MSWKHPRPTPDDTREAIDRVHPAEHPVVHPQRVAAALRRERPALGRFNGWLADHIVGLAGTMIFFYALGLLIGGWALWQSAFASNDGFDGFPYAFLFFVLGGIMQSLFVPTMLTASNRAAERDRLKDEADHRAATELYTMNQEQLELLRRIDAVLAAGVGSRG